MLKANSLTFAFLICTISSFAQFSVQCSTRLWLFNNSFADEDIGVRIFIDDKLYLETESLNDLIKADKNYGLVVDSGTHVILVDCMDYNFNSVDTFNACDSSTFAISISYEHIPDKKSQFGTILESRFNHRMHQGQHEDSTLMFQAVQLQLMEDRNQVLKDPLERNFEIKILRIY